MESKNAVFRCSTVWTQILRHERTQAISDYGPGFLIAQAGI
jgi:hypothetical protein